LVCRIGLALCASAHAQPVDCAPGLEYTAVPAYGTDGLLEGRALCVDPAAHRVATYIRVGGGWYNKPTFAEPLSPLDADGRFATQVVTHPNDRFATALRSFLLPDGVAPPRVDGLPNLPAALDDAAAASTGAERAAPRRTIDFGGREWAVKGSQTPLGPGPNHWLATEEAVEVDEDGRLHLRIREREGRWYSAEVVATESLGFGTYRWRIAGPHHDLDPNIVVGLFTWDNDAPEVAYRELDIELARWGQAAGPTNAQFVVQPYEPEGHLERFTTPARPAVDYAFTWLEDGVDFVAQTDDELHAEWRFDGEGVPPLGPSHARINFWLFRGEAPTNGEEAELVVEAFEFTPPATPDAGLTDTGPIDAAAPDAGPIDAATPDAGPIDAATPDAAPTDSHAPDSEPYADTDEPPPADDAGCTCRAHGSPLMIGLLLLLAVRRRSQPIGMSPRRSGILRRS